VAVTTQALDRFGNPTGDLAWGTVENLAFTDAASAQSAALSSETKVVRLCATAACYVLIGNDPTASATAGTLLPANEAERVAIPAGLATPKVAVRGVSGASGTLSITQCNA
jgi:hypothetical protein